MAPGEIERLRKEAAGDSSDDDLVIEEVATTAAVARTTAGNGARPAGFCEHCGKVGARARCGRCKKVFFCDGRCQRKGWPKHKLSCGTKAKPPAKLSAPAPAPKPAPAPEPAPAAPPAAKAPPASAGMWGSMVTDLNAAPDPEKKPAAFIPMSASRPFGFGARRF